MKPWKLFVVFFISYPVILYGSFLVILIIGFGFTKNVPYFLSAITRMILGPVGLVNMAMSHFIPNQVNKFVIIIIADFIVSLTFTAIVIGIKTIIKGK